MAEYRTIRMSFWNDPFIEELEASEKLLYLYLFTNSSTNNIGLLELSRKRISFETGLSVSDVNSGIAKLESSGKIVVEGTLIWLRQFIKHQSTTSPKIVESLQNLLNKVESQELRHTICIQYPHLKDISDTLSVPYTDGMGTVSEGYSNGTDTFRAREEERERERKKEDKESTSEAGKPHRTPASKKSFPEELTGFVSQFQAKVSQEHGNLAPKVTEKLVYDGADALDKCVRIDGLSLDEVKAAAMWAITDPFWGQNLRSLGQMRTVGNNGVSKIKNVIADYRKAKPVMTPGHRIATNPLFRGAI